jgi:hypothetical protein
MRRRTVCVAYLVACGLALTGSAAAASGLLDGAPARMAHIAALALGAPWTLLAREVAGAGPVGALAMTAAAMALNLAILSAVRKRFASRRSQ